VERTPDYSVPTHPVVRKKKAKGPSFMMSKSERLFWIFLACMCVFTVLLGRTEQNIGQEYDLFFQACECQP
jgi:hypothetical protein